MVSAEQLQESKVRERRTGDVIVLTSISADVASSSSLDVASRDVFLSHCCIWKMLWVMSLC